MNALLSAYPEKLHRYFIIIFCILFALLPLYPQMSSIEMTFLFRSCVVLFAGMMIGLYGWQHTWNHLRSHPLTIPVIFILFVALMGCFYSPDFYRAKAKWALYVSVFLCFVLIRLSAHDVQANRFMLWALFLGGVFTAFYALYVQMGGNASAIQSLQNYQIYEAVMQAEIIKTLEANRAMGSFGNPNHLAGYVVLSLWAAWYLFCITKNRWLRMSLTAAGLLMIFCIYQTYSRSGLLVLAVSMLLMACYYVFFKKRIPVKPVILISIPLILLGCAALYLFQDQLLGGRLLVNSTLIARLHFFRGGLLILQDFPWLGAGTESFESYYSALLRPGDIEARYVHNIILESALQWGLLGLLTFAWLCIAFLFFIWTALRTQSSPELAFAALGSALSLLLFSLVDFHNHLIEMYLIPVFFAASMGHANAPQTPSSKPLPFAGVVSLLFFCFWVGLIVCPFLNGLCKQRGYDYSLDHQYAQARDFYEWALYMDPSDGESWNHLGHITRNNPMAHSPFFLLQYMENAVYWSPRRASFRADYAHALYINGLPDRAVQEMRHAQELFPAKPVYYEQLASLFEAMGQPEAAKEQRQTAETLKTQIKENRL